MGAYYRDWLSDEHLLSRQGCQDAGRIYIWADTDQRTLETGRAFAQSLLPGCGLTVHSRPEGEKDPLFSGVGTSDPGLSLEAVRDRLAPDSEKLLSDLRTPLATLQFILTGGEKAPAMLTLPTEITASVRGKSVDLNGPFAAGSTLSEDLLLEYVDGMKGSNLGWGRLNEGNLHQILEIHSVESDLLRRTPYLARARGSNLLLHVLRSIEQAETGKPVPGALGQPGDSVLILAGHDTNLSNISGILGLSWHLQGYRTDETPPGGALVFSLWQDPDSRRDFVRTQYVAQTPDQMRNAVRLTVSRPPAEEGVSIPGCDSAGHNAACSWSLFKSTLEHAIGPSLVSDDRDRGDP